MTTHFPASDFELVVPDWPVQDAIGYICVSDELCAKMVRATTQRALPRGSGLRPQRILSGHFNWKWWGLKDDYGRLLVKREGSYRIGSDHASVSKSQTA